MSIFQRKARKDEWWIDLRFEGHRIRRRSPIQTPEGAQEFHNKTITDLAIKAAKDVNPLAVTSTYVEFAERWMTDFVAVANRPSTQREKRIALERRLVPAFGHRNRVEVELRLAAVRGPSQQDVNGAMARHIDWAELVICQLAPVPNETTRQSPVEQHAQCDRKPGLTV